MNHFHNRTTIDCSAPTFVMPQQTTTSTFGQGYAHTTHNFLCQTLVWPPYTPGYNGRAYTNPIGNYQASHTTVASTDPILLPSSLAGFLPNSAYHNVMRHNTLGQPKFGSFDYETPSQFLIIQQPIDMTLVRANAELGADPNNLTNQLDTILRESYDRTTL
jgi:hypothetical protein